MKRIYFICLFLCLTVLFAVRPAQAQTETVLYNFSGGSDGGYPYSNLTFDSAGNLYGTTYGGGTFGYGTVFEVSPNGNGGWNEAVLYSFTGGADGSEPFGPVIFDSVGNLYGTTYAGGANGFGAVFELSPVGTSWMETVLYSFAGGTDGAYPRAGLIMDPAGNLYGATFGSEPYYPGTVFELSPSGGGWKEQVIYAVNMASGVTMDPYGNIFGVNGSTAFELSPNGNGGWNSTVIHTFPTGPKDGSGAWGTPVLDQAGNLYGTTFEGGVGDLGTVYRLSPVETGKKKGEWKEKILESFRNNENHGPIQGAYPYAGVVFDRGNIYVTTVEGGKHLCGGIFVLLFPSYHEKYPLWGFNGEDGFQPYASVILDGAGNLYGTTLYGGLGAHGVVFEVSP